MNTVTHTFPNSNLCLTHQGVERLERGLVAVAAVVDGLAQAWRRRRAAAKADREMREAIALDPRIAADLRCVIDQAAAQGVGTTAL